MRCFGWVGGWVGGWVSHLEVDNEDADLLDGRDEEDH